MNVVRLQEIFWVVATQMFLGFSPPKIGEDEPILTNIFSNRLKPPARCYLPQLMVNCWFGARWFGILRVPLSNNPFHKGNVRNSSQQPKPAINH